MKILCFGEILWDVYPDKKYIGGASLNFAGHMARHGEDAYMLSALGCDSLGKEAEAVLRDLGLHTKYVAKKEDKETGTCLVTLDEHSIPSYRLLEEVAYDDIPCDSVDEDFDVLYFGTLSLRSDHNFFSLQRLLQDRHFGEILCDVNIRPPFYSERSVRLCAEHATVLKISLEEYQAVADVLRLPDAGSYQNFAKLLACSFPNLKCILITLGSLGSYALDCTTQKEYSCGCPSVRVVSTVGAGDSFSAAFLHHYLRGRDILFCIEYASRVAGFVVSCFDAIPNYRAEDLI